MDAAATGTALRLPPSYGSGHLAEIGLTTAYTYDVSLTIIAYATREDPESLSRARTLADTLIQLQASDPAQDGRLRGGYEPIPWDEDGEIIPVMSSSDTGNLAWAGLALLRVHALTGEPQYLQAATRLGEWIVNNTWDDRGSGGFTGGRDGDDQPIEWKSIEHNLDAYALFTQLAEYTGEGTWTQAADHARDLLDSLWEPDDGHFWIGTTSDGETINTEDYVPQDGQSWSWLALRDPEYAAALDWVSDNLAVSDGKLSGVKVADQDDPTSAIWLEGTAQFATALICRNYSGDYQQALDYLETLRLAQTQAPGADGKGIVAASQDGTAGGDNTIYSSTHTGTTSWFIFAATGTNPLSTANCST